MFISILIAIIAASLLATIMLIAKGAKTKSQKKTSDVISRKGRNTVIREAEKKLSHDPHNVPALESLGELYFSENNWAKTWNVYKTLYDISAVHVEVDQTKATLRMGVAAYYLEKIDDAVNALMIAMRKNSSNYDIAYYLGLALYKKGVYDKAIYCLKRAHEINPNSTAVNEPLGLSFFKMEKYKESLPFLKHVLEEHPGNKEVMFNMAVAMLETGYGDKSLKVFMHLRPDPVFGARSCLEAGRIHEKTKSIEQAIQDYEIGMKLENVDPQILIQIKYRCASCYISEKNISKGLALLKQVQAMNPTYKDVNVLVTRYTELNQNSNLQTYLLSGTSDFVALCRKLIQAYYQNANIKIEDVSVASESIEILCAVETGKWSDKELFRFYRSSNVVGDIYIRDMHSKIRDIKCDKGICVTMGSFSDSAHKFIEGRPIDFIEKDVLIKILKKVNMFD